MVDGLPPAISFGSKLVGGLFWKTVVGAKLLQDCFGKDGRWCKGVGGLFWKWVVGAKLLEDCSGRRLLAPKALEDCFGSKLLAQNCCRDRKSTR